MRSLQVILGIGDSSFAAGPSYSVPALGRALGANGVPTVLASIDRAPIPPSQGFEHRVFQAGSGPRKLYRSPKMRQEMNNLVAAADVVHSHVLWNMPGLYAGKAAQAAGLPNVVSPRGTMHPRALEISSTQKRLFGVLFQDRVLAGASAFHGTSNDEACYIRQLGYRQPIAIIPNGVDLPCMLSSRVSSSKTRQLVYLGRIHPIKGLSRLLEAWSSLSKSGSTEGWRLDLVGPDAEGHTAELKEMVSKKKIPNVSFLPAVFGEDKFKLLGSADLYVLPTDSENFGMTVAEALACGTPVITTKGAPWEDLEKNGCGWWTEVSVEGIQSALLQALKMDSVELNRRGVKGKALVKNHYSWRGVCDKMGEFYGWLIEGCPLSETPTFVDTV